MKTLVLFYSYTGKTKELAKAKAAELDADIIEVREVKNRGKANAYVVGCFQALLGKKSRIEPIKVILGKYGKFVILTPIWAGRPAPAFNSIAELLPKGKKVELFMTSSSGASGNSADKVKAIIKGRGCEVVGYTDVKS